MKKILLLAALFCGLCNPSFGQGSSAHPVVMGFLSAATTGSAGCTTLGMGSPPCFVPYSTTNRLPITTSGAPSSGVTSFTGDGALLSNSASTDVVTATLGNAAANSVWGNAIASSGAPSYSNSPSVLALTTTTLTVKGNATLAGTTTANNLTITGTCIGCSSSGTINSGLANQIAYYAADGTAISGHAMLSTTTAGIAINGFNGIRVPDLGLDVTSIAVGRAALASYATTTGSNVAVGYNALNASTTSTSSVAVGAMALSKETIVGSEVAIGAGALQNSLQTITTAGNVAIGFNAMNATITSSANVAIGYQAGVALLGGTGGNVAIGYQTLATSTAAVNTVAIGKGAGKSLTNGNDNTLIGASAGINLSTGSENVIVGNSSNANPGSFNLLLGYNAGGSATGGSLTAVGHKALSGVSSSGCCNTAIGESAGNHITTGSNNTILGNAVGSLTITTGSTNILIGVSNTTDTALGITTSAIGVGVGAHPGSSDVAIGGLALNGTTTNDNHSVAVGYKAGTAITTGIGNTIFGYQAGALVTTGTGNTVLGNSVASTVLTIGTNNILIGTNNAITATTSSESNAIHIGGTGGDAVFVTGTNTNTTETMTLHGIVSMPDITQTSSAQTGTLCWASSGVTYDASLGCLTSTKENKERISSFSGGLAEVMKFKPISFYYKDKKMDASEELGLLAEDVKEVEPRLVGYGSDGKLRGVRYEQLTAVLISAIQEQQKEIDALKKQRVHHK